MEIETQMTIEPAAALDRTRIARERVVGLGLIAVGLFLAYLVLFDQGAALAVAGGGSKLNYLHEFFHDGRHLANVPCH